MIINMTINFSRNIRLVGSLNSLFSFSFPSPPPLLIHPFLDAKFIRLNEKSSSVPKAITSDCTYMLMALQMFLIVTLLCNSCYRNLIDHFRYIKIQLGSEALRTQQRKVYDQVCSFLLSVSSRPRYQDEF